MGKRSRRVNRIAFAALAVIVGVVAGIAVSEATASGGSGYRTASVTVASVEKTLTIGGTTQPVNQATAAFQVGGTVSAVKVASGQHVTAGQTIATLDSTSLQQQVSVAQTNLAAAQAVLAENEAGQAAGITGGGSAQTAALVSGGAMAVLTADVHGRGQTSLKQAQQAVVNDQHTADMDLQMAALDLRNAETTCSRATAGPPPTTTPPTGTPPTRTPHPSTTTTTTPQPTTTTTTPHPTTTTTPSTTTASTTSIRLTSATLPGTACTEALNQAMVAEKQVATDQKDLAAAETTLAQVLSSLPATPTTPSSGQSKGSGQTGRTGQSSGTQGSGGSFSSNSGSNSSNSSGVAVNSAQQLASDQAAIDSDQAALVRAQQSLADAQLTSPMAGTVAAVSLQAGQTVTGGSTSSAVQIINPGSYQSTASLTSSQVAAIKVGDTAQVTVDGTSGTLSGVVTRVGPVLASGSTYSYPVVVALDSTAPGIAAGSAGQIQIDLAQAHDALVVPTSAVHTTSAGRSFVTVLQAGKPVTRTVTLGVVGATYTQILSGVTRGTTVVLADLSSPVPSSSSNLNSGRSGGLGGAGGFGGGGGFGGRAGLGGGGFPTGAVRGTAVLG